MKIIFALLIFLIVLCSISNREHFTPSPTTIENGKEKSDKLKPNRVDLSALSKSDNESIKLLNKYMNSIETKNACDKLYEYCGENLDLELDDDVEVAEKQRKYTDGHKCGQFNYYQLGICTQDLYNAVIKNIEDGKTIISNKKLPSNTLFGEEDYFVTGNF